MKTIKGEHLIKSQCYDFSAGDDVNVDKAKKVVQYLQYSGLGSSIEKAGVAYLDAGSLLAECRLTIERVSKELAECWNEKGSAEAQAALRYIHATVRELSDKGNEMGRPLESLGKALPEYGETGGSFSWSEGHFFSESGIGFYDTKDGMDWWTSAKDAAKKHLQDLGKEIQTWHDLLPSSLRKELPDIKDDGLPDIDLPKVTYNGGPPYVPTGSNGYPDMGPYGTNPYGTNPYGQGPNGTGAYDPNGDRPNGTGSYGPDGNGSNGTGPYDPDGNGGPPRGDGGPGNQPGSGGPGAGMPGVPGRNGTDPTGGLTDPSGNLTDPSRNLTYPAGYDPANARTTDLSSFQPPQGYDGIGNPNSNNPNLSGLNTSTGTSPAYTGSPTNTGTGNGTGGIGSSGSFGTAGVRAAALNAAEGAAGSGMFVPPVGGMGGAGAGGGEQKQETGSNLWEHDDVWGANDHEGAVDGHIRSV